MFSYKSFCWSLGTTSFRTVAFNLKIEQQLSLLSEFKALPEYVGRDWADLQVDYYRFMHERGFIVGDAQRPAKDAREKTSGLVDVGLIDDERCLTGAGKALLAITKSGDFAKNNPLQIPNDSFIYLKQLLKMHDNVSGDIVRPFVVSVYVISKLGGHLTKDEFTFLLPLCTTSENTESIIESIRKLRLGETTIDEIILDVLMKMDNLKAALAYFLKGKVSERIIIEIGINRKSRNYDKPYYKFYDLLRKVAMNKDVKSILPLLAQSKIIKSKAAGFWRAHLFNTVAESRIKREGLAVLNDVPIFSAKSEKEFRKLFFELLHLFKAKATLRDYYDLNSRYFKTTDTVIFTDGKVELDILAKVWLDVVKNNLHDIAFTASDNLAKNVDLPEIASFLAIDEKKLYAEVSRLFGITITTAGEAAAVISDERHKRFNRLIDEHFDKNTLIDLFSKFESRDDEAIRKAVTNNADIPTIFEYIIGVAWYQISGRKGKILDYMNLSLEADLLPRSHATGGNADIEYLYEQTPDYPAHCLLIEATLADKTNQRRMEMEPVSRHLGEYILKTEDRNAYCVFVSTYLDINVINDFRGRKMIGYIDKKTMSHIKDMKIIPLETKEIQTMLAKDIDYSKLYMLFDNAHKADTNAIEWYNRLNSMIKIL